MALSAQELCLATHILNSSGGFVNLADIHDEARDPEDREPRYMVVFCLGETSKRARISLS